MKAGTTHLRVGRKLEFRDLGAQIFKEVTYLSLYKLKTPCA